MAAGLGGSDSGTRGTEKLFVTRPLLPPLGEFLPYLEEIWASQTLTNGGPMHQRLEGALAERLGVRHISLFANGTLALSTAIRALGLRGEVITTPYSFVATTHALVRAGLEPVFVDIDPISLNLDPARIEEAITPRTSGILPVHCYGMPCDVATIGELAAVRGLRVLYDAAHAFGVCLPGRNLLECGDCSALSFHATKVFNTGEGGAVVTSDPALKRYIDRLKNFGFVDEVTVNETGLNAKMSEITAALGLLQLKYVDAALRRRSEIDRRYRERLADIPGITCVAAGAWEGANHSYFPILVGDGFRLSRDGLYRHLAAHGIYGRRYFHPLISQFPMYCGLASAQPSRLPVATRIASQVLCLPIYPTLSDTDIDRVVDCIHKGR
ncbi:MAG: DegT/DnrJ/EryC1/StrS family aminotransferase [Planctomycetaceae bacterium]